MAEPFPAKAAKVLRRAAQIRQAATPAIVDKEQSRSTGSDSATISTCRASSPVRKSFPNLFICLTPYTAAFDIGTWVRSDALKYGRQSNIKLVAIRLPDSILKSKI